MRKKIKCLAAGLLLCAACGGVYAASLALRGSTKAEAKPIPLSADEVARVLNLQMYSYEIQVPPGSYTLHVWLEHWTRGVNEPEIGVLATIGGGAISEHESLTVCLPTTSHPDSYVRWGGVSTGTTSTTPIDLKRINGWSAMDARPVVIGQDIPLAALVVNPLKPIDVGTEHVEQDHDETYYLRARFESGKLGGGAAKWKDGRVTFNIY